MKTRYVALLRGINVGGKNLIKMPALKACFEEQGYGDVVTYIASGNVLFTAEEPRAKLERTIEAALGAAFSYRASVLLRSRKEMQVIVGRAPEGFGTDPDAYRYDVIFLKAPLTPAAALKGVPTQPEVDEVHAGSGVLYFSRLASKAAQSRIARVTGMAIYQNMSIRNWNTTTALLRLMD